MQKSHSSFKSAVLDEVPSALLLFHLPVGAPWTAVDSDRNTWFLATHAEELDGILEPGFFWPTPCHHGHLNSESVDGKSVSLSLPLSLLLCPSDKHQKIYKTKTIKVLPQISLSLAIALNLIGKMNGFLFTTFGYNTFWRLLNNCIVIFIKKLLYWGQKLLNSVWLF